MKAYHLLLGASALALVAQSAAAEVDNPWYFTVRGGVSIAENSDLRGPVTGTAFDTDPKKGIAFGAGLGYDFGGVRLEAELRRQENSVKKLYATNVAAFGVPRGTYGTNTGDQNATALMGNLYYDMNFGGGFKPYIGFGLGAARVNFDSIRAAGSVLVDDSKTVFAYQGIAGVRQRLSDAIDLTLDYRYFKTEDVKIQDGLGARIKGDYTDHIVMLGLVWKFGGKKAVPETPVAAPAPAPAPEPAPEPVAPPPPPPGPFVVYFDFDKSTIDAESARIIEQAAAASGEMPSIQIFVRGYTDTSGSNEYNQKLSERRAKAVYDELIKRGVPANAMGLEAYGETNLAVETADGVKERLNRRVTIRYGE